MEKVGKMVFKIKPSKSGINKLPLFRQFRPACKKLGSSDETFWRTWKFSAKWYMYIFYSTSAREGPLPLPNCFFCYTRPSSTLKVTWLIFVLGIFWNQKRAWSCIDITSCAQANTWTSTHSHSQCALRAQMPMLN